MFIFERTTLEARHYFSGNVDQKHDNVYDDPGMASKLSGRKTQQLKKSNTKNNCCI